MVQIITKRNGDKFFFFEVFFLRVCEHFLPKNGRISSGDDKGMSREKKFVRHLIQHSSQY